ncbi:hypothetical protein FRB99_004898 [Tulasnella sp. 403]|nr:hypothetical protein FRB99_004898 [Tulasnella sp. 403]
MHPFVLNDQVKQLRIAGNKRLRRTYANPAVVAPAHRGRLQSYYSPKAKPSLARNHVGKVEDVSYVSPFLSTPSQKVARSIVNKLSAASHTSNCLPYSRLPLDYDDRRLPDLRSVHVPKIEETDGSTTDEDEEGEVEAMIIVDTVVRKPKPKARSLLANHPGFKFVRFQDSDTPSSSLDIKVEEPPSLWASFAKDGGLSDLPTPTRVTLVDYDFPNTQPVYRVDDILEKMASQSSSMVPFEIASLVSAGMYPANGPVKMLTNKNFKKTLSEDRPVMVAFIAPWCGHCKNLVPEYLKAAKSLDPLVPFYAVDCDVAENKPICGEQASRLVFPLSILKTDHQISKYRSFPRGTKTLPHDYQGERKAGPIIDWMSQKVPNRVAPVKGEEGVAPWLKKNENQPRALLLTSKPRTPLLWKVLGAQFNKKIVFGAAKDIDGSIAKSLGIESADGTESHILIWDADATEPVAYKGAMKHEPLFKHLNAVLEGPKRSKEEL